MNTVPPAPANSNSVSDSTETATGAGRTSFLVPDPSPPFDIPGLTFHPLHERYQASGKCMFREMKIHLPAEQSFKRSWNSQKKAWLERGFWLRNDNGTWYVNQWLAIAPDGYQLTAIGRERLLALGKPKDLGLPPEPEIVLDLPDLPEHIASKLFPYQVEPARKLLRSLQSGRNEWGFPGAWDSSEMGTGKAQPVSSMVLTPTGWINIGKLRIGDEVIGVDGKPTTVTGVFPQGQKPIFRVTLTDGAETHCCDDHLWLVETINDRNRKKPGKVKPLKELRTSIRSCLGYKWFIPLTKPVEFATGDCLPLDPYLLGVILGDGCLRASTPRVSLPDQEMVERVAGVLPDGHKLHFLKGSAFDYSIYSDHGPNQVTSALRQMELMGLKSEEKFIPSVYLSASVADRLALMQGLFDTDGHASGAAVEYSSSSPELTGQLRQLVECHGGTASVSERAAPAYTHNGERRIGKKNYRVRVALPLGVDPFRLKRKASALVIRTKYHVKRAIKSVEPAGEAECVCISVSDPKRLYLTDHCIVTHNTYQSLAAAVATGLEIGVVCPMAVIPAWKRAFTHFGAVPRFVRNYESLRTGNRDWVSKEAFTNALGKPARRFRWNMEPSETVLIFDEAHLAKTPGSLNQNLLLAAVRQGFHIICCSGTMATDPTHMRATGRVVGLHKGAESFTDFMLAHNCETQNGKTFKFYGGRRGREALARINRTIFPRRGTRVRTQDLGAAFPETQIMAEAFATTETKAIQEAFAEAQEMIERMERQGASEHEVKMRKASAYLEAWHKSERAKVPTIAAMVEQELEAGRSVAVFVNFTDVRLALMKALSTQCAIYGGQNAAHREQCIADFQSDKQRVIVANIDAGGVGVSLHDLHGNHPRTSIILPTNKVVSLSQALGRVHRAGGKTRSRQLILFAADTIEETICATIRRRMAQITTLNDGDLYPEDKF